eukprot:280642_1
MKIIQGAHQNKSNQKCITMSLLLFIIVSVIGIISYSQNTEMPEISTIKVPNIIFDSADMLNDEYKPISNVSIQYGFNLTFNQQTKPVNVLNFGNGLASDITGVLQIDIQRIVIIKFEQSLENQYLYYA